MRHDDPTQKIKAYAEDDTTAAPAPTSTLKRWFFRLITFALFMGVLGAGVVVLLFSVLARELPTIRSLDDYHPKQATVVYGAQDQVVARFSTERRTVVPFDRIPQVMIDAVLAAEDAEFFEHAGLDYIGILRCAVKSALRGRTVCGGSTITQQMVKTFLLTSEKRMTRKIKEAILTKRVEDHLSKPDILFLYLNQIYFGHGAYGVQEAARVYFGKNVEHLTIEEAALLAGLPQLPTRLDPFKYPERARRRRSYVLGQMLRLEKITPEQYERAFKAPIAVDWARSEDIDSNNHYAAHVKTLLLDKLGEGTTDGGYRIYTGIDPVMQRAAEQSVKAGLREVDKRQGWRGPLMHLEPDEIRTFKKMLVSRLSTVTPSIGELEVDGKPAEFQPVIWDLAYVPRRKADWVDLAEVVRRARFRRFVMDRIVGGLVTKVDDTNKEAIVALAPGVDVRIPLRTGMAWARKFDTYRFTRRPRKPSDVLAVGDVVLVKPTVLGGTKAARTITGELEQAPNVQAAMVAIDPQTREVRALVGGFGLGAGTFNRATQARRQAGSTFKPLLYASAFETGDYTTITNCQDAPRVYRDPWTGKSWKPKNYGDKFDGIITLRKALTLSKNLCSVELIDKIGVDKAIDTARRAGVISPLPRSLTLGLGSGDVTPLEMVNSYATLASGGQLAEPVFIRKIVDPNGKTTFTGVSEPTQKIAPEVTYQIISLMQSVVEDGTARRVKSLERPVAGKTGTTNEARNAWFIGFTPDLVAGVWVGFDDNAPLGPGETGGRAAIPIWLSFMTEAVKDTPKTDFIAPAGIVFAFVDPVTKKLADPNSETASYEPFIAGTEPTEMASEAKPPTEFGLDDWEQ